MSVSESWYDSADDNLEKELDSDWEPEDDKNEDPDWEPAKFPTKD